MKLRTGMMGMAMMAGVSLGMNAQTAVDSRMLVNAPPAPAGIMGGLAGGVSLGMSSVKGQPYTLVEKTTTVKLLSDATTTITTVREEKKSRDGEGRERTESGTIKDGVFVPQFVRISDPVAHTSTTLMPQPGASRKRRARWSWRPTRCRVACGSCLAWTLKEPCLPWLAPGSSNLRANKVRDHCVQRTPFGTCSSKG